VRVQKCTRGFARGRIFSNPAGLPAGGFSPNPHPLVPSLLTRNLYSKKKKKRKREVNPLHTSHLALQMGQHPNCTQANPFAAYND